MNNEELVRKMCRQYGWPEVGERVRYVQPKNTLYQSGRDEHGRRMIPMYNPRVERTGRIMSIRLGVLAIGFGASADVDYQVQDELNGEVFDASGHRVTKI